MNKKIKLIKPYQRAGRSNWAITYRVPGYKKSFYESFESLEEANLRAAEINFEKAKGTLRPPTKEAVLQSPTLSEFLDDYVKKHGSVQWGDSQYSIVTRLIRDYINTDSISSLLIKDIRTADIDDFYLRLLETPAVIRKGHADNGKKVGIHVVEKIHSTLKAAFNKAIVWGYIERNPVMSATVPRVERKKREVWTSEDAQNALSACTCLLLKVCMLLAIGCSMRIGEILGLKWSDIIITEHSMLDNTSTLTVKRTLKRCDKDSLEATHLQGKIFFTFPPRKSDVDCRTILVLKTPKTDSSVRTLYIPNTVAAVLLQLKADQEKEKEKFGSSYSDYDLVFAQPDGYPTEERFIAKKFKKLIADNNLPEVVFHSLRHLSTSMKLKLSHGDIKAVQGDTGHSQADMITDVYGHTCDKDRKHVADLMEESFFAAREAGNQGKKTEQVIILLKEKPELVDILFALSKSI